MPTHRNANFLALSEKDALNLTPGEWKKCRELVEVLEPFESTTWEIWFSYGEINKYFNDRYCPCMLNAHQKPLTIQIYLVVADLLSNSRFKFK